MNRVLISRKGDIALLYLLWVMLKYKNYEYLNNDSLQLVWDIRINYKLFK